jgi:hypothetical protein
MFFKDLFVKNVFQKDQNKKITPTATYSKPKKGRYAAPALIPRG